MKPRDLLYLRPKGKTTGGTLVRLLCPLEDLYSGKSYTRYKVVDDASPFKGTVFFGPNGDYELVGAN